MPIPPLPYETLSEIVRHVVDKTTLRSLLLTSPWFKSIAEPFLYHTVELYTPHKTLQFLLSTTSPTRTDTEIAKSIFSCQSLILSDHALGATYKLLQDFLEKATNLHTLSILGPEAIPTPSPTALPNLKIAGGTLEILAELCPGRPIEEIIVSAADTVTANENMKHLSGVQKSTRPIQGLTIVTGQPTNAALIGVSLYATSLFLGGVKHLMLNFILTPQFARENLTLIANTLRDHKELRTIGIVNWDKRGILDDLETQLFFIRRCLEHSPRLEQFEFPFTKFHRWREAGDADNPESSPPTPTLTEPGEVIQSVNEKWIRMEKFEECGACGCGCQCSCSEVDIESGKVTPWRQVVRGADQCEGEIHASESIVHPVIESVEDVVTEIVVEVEAK
jgi:hypothetical protein